MSRRSRRLMVVLAASLGLAVAAGIGLQAFETQVTSSQGPTGYRGIVAANFMGLDNGEEVVGDFGSQGVWLYHHFGTWVKLTSENPEWMFAVRFAPAADAELVADFGAKGLWMWNCGDSYSDGTWTQLTTANAENGIAVDDDWDGNEELEVDFGTVGLWRYDWDTKAWNQLTPNNPVGSGLRVSPNALHKGAWSFGSAGLWLVRWYGAPSWSQLSATPPADDWASGNFVDSLYDEDELIVDFGALGTWLWEAYTSAWVKLTDSSPAAIVPVKFGEGIVDAELLFADASYAPWCWWGGSVWERVTYTAMDTGFVVPYDSDYNRGDEPASEQELAGDFGSLGLWDYNYVASGGAIGVWTQLTTANPVFMVAADHWGDGHQGELVVDFGPGTGLWIWDSGASNFNTLHQKRWIKMTDSVPDSSLSW